MMTHPSGYFDLQVNGYAGIDFNTDGLTGEQLHLACERLRADGVSGILATIITDQIEAMCRRLARLVELRQSDRLAAELIPGLHVEGPFISTEKGYVGAHPADAVCPADADKMQRLIDAGGGLVRLVTLAPEQDVQMRVTRMLSDQGIVVAAGHTDASLDQLKAACDAGLTLFTHLGNGCPMHLHRHDNIIQRGLSLADRITPCFIADGAHVPFVALGNYLRLAGLERCIVVTDCMAAAGLGAGRHRIGRWEVDVGQDLVAWAPDRSHFLGSAMSMPQAHQNLRKHLGLSDEQCHALLSDNPRRAVEISMTKSQ